MKKTDEGKIVIVKDQDVRETFEMMETVFGNGSFDGKGKLVSISPTDLREFGEEFSALTNEEATQHLDDQAVYYDEGAQRHFVLPIEDLEVSQ